ncbi:MAG: AmmeMemoRadiSam system radical SAM enzyme [Proteobacteria bacterium]|nr:AmmeMemoRadiSam system radical SAM enzyme [Pseudomonadota bacterium]
MPRPRSNPGDPAFKADSPRTDPKQSRRRFLKTALRSGIVLGGAGMANPLEIGQFAGAAQARTATADSLAEIVRQAPVARYWMSSAAVGGKCLECHDEVEDPQVLRFKHDESVVGCRLCAHGCIIEKGQRGRCRARMNVDGQLRTLVYGRPISVHVDPIEKKPFYHFRPGSAAFSMATSGCPLRCKFCQNWEISQASPEDYSTRFIPPEVIVQATEKYKAPIIAYTYNEPTVFTEYLTDIARVAVKKNISSVLVSCGFVQRDPLTEICSLLDAIKIDLKGFSKNFYEQVCNARLEPVLRSIKQVSKNGVHLEIVNLVVPTLNDSKKMLTELSKWVVGELGPDVPVHFTRFHPDYKMLNLPPTPVTTLERAYETAKTAGMHFPYVGNVPGHPGNNTHCPSCGETVIQRTGFFVLKNDIIGNQCGHCRKPVAGVWN